MIESHESIQTKVQAGDGHIPRFPALLYNPNSTMTLAPIKPNLTLEQALKQLEDLKLYCKLPVLALDRLRSGDIEGAILLLQIFPGHVNESYFPLKLYLQRAAIMPTPEYDRTTSANETLKQVVAQLSDKNIDALITLAHGLLWSEHTEQAVRSVAEEFHSWSNEAWMGTPEEEF